ncbi:MAG: TldD/PmbA family protein [Candidatus Fermentibacter sp.]|nr:TldD/PmbA family protein [Candidatus Fermentibacter sp.]
MKKLAEFAVAELAASGADYGDVRVEDRALERIAFRNRRLEEAATSSGEGVGVRAIIGGCWGFASATGLGRDSVAMAVERAVRIARSGAGRTGSPVRLAPQAPVQGSYSSPCVEDPFGIDTSEKIGLLEQCSCILNADPAISTTYAELYSERIDRVFANTDGTLVDSHLVHTQPFLLAYAVKDGDAQNRSLQTGARAAGWEWIRENDLPAASERIRDQAVEKVMASEGPSGVMDLVLDGINLSLTMHESVGHATESDRALGWEANMAGRTFVGLGDQGSLKYGSEIVNFTADNTMPIGLASWGWDDDGTPCQKWHTIRDGVFQEFGTVRETALLVGRSASRGCCRAQDFGYFPINRQPNFYLEPSETPMTPEELIAGVRHGILIEGRGSFSIDQNRVNFQFGGDFFREIRDGKPGRPLKKVLYGSRTTEFWGSCDGIADARFFQPMGLLTCGKGEPMQGARMTHGASPARFRGVTVGGGVR